MRSRFRTIQTILTPLRVLEAAARLGSFTKAASELGLSQPSVSRHIASLEEDLTTARSTLEAVEKHVKLEEVTDKLLADGVKQFADAFDKLLAAVEAAKQAA